MLGPRLDVTSPVRLTEAVDRHHPLNFGRVAWWLALPGSDGGRQWFDLLGPNHATLANMTSASGWRGTTRPGGWGCLQFTGAQYADAGPGGKVTTGRITVACWVRPDVTSRGDLMTRWSNAVSPGDQFDLLYGLTAGVPQFFIADGGGGSDDSGIGSTAMAVGSWHRVVGTFDGGTIAVYLDGILQSSRATAKTLGVPNDSVGYRIGDDTNAAGPTTGALDDVSIWSRALSASEVRADFDLSRRGYPGVLNRLEFSTLAGPTPGPSVAGSATLTGLSALTATGSLAIPGAASLVAQATLTAGAAIDLHGAAALASTSTLTGAAALAIPGAASLVAQATLSASGLGGTPTATLGPNPARSTIRRIGPDATRSTIMRI